MDHIDREDLNKNLAEKLKERRTNKGLSQRQLGYAIDVTDNTIGNWENGRGELLVWVKRMRLLCIELGCKLDDLLNGAYGIHPKSKALPHIAVQSKNLGNLLAKNRKDKNLSQRQLGYTIDVTDNTIGNWENGKGELLVWFKRLRLLCNELDCTLDDLLNDAYRVPANTNNPIKPEIPSEPILYPEPEISEHI
jgi:transcriptional regulator with XRE-family HTH domain